VEADHLCPPTSLLPPVLLGPLQPEYKKPGLLLLIATRHDFLAALEEA